MKVDQKDLELLAAVNAQFPRLRQFLQTRFDGYVDTLIKAESGLASKAQGRAAELKDLMDLLDQARDRLK